VKVLVAGGTGFIGRHTVRALIDAGHEVVVLARGVTPPDLTGMEAIVNLVGIAAPRGANTFTHAHIEVPRQLVALGARLCVRRFVHVGVVDVPENTTVYADSKRRGEQLIRASGLPWTILRPALVYGPGDAMLTRLAGLIQAAPVFAVPAGSTGPLQVVDVEDVAAAIVAALSRPDAVERIYDIAGPERLSLRALVQRVADGLGLSVATLGLPRACMRIAASALERLPRPLVTRSQVEMLIAGLFGDPRAAHADLGVQPRALSPARVQEIAEALPSPWWSIRLVADPAHRHWLRSHAAVLGSLRWFLPLLLASMLLMPTVLEGIWARMAAIDLGLAAVALTCMPLGWRALLRPSVARVAAGVAAAAVMFGGALMVLTVVARLAPEFVTQAATVYAWVDLLPPAMTMVAGAAIVAAEDIVWRGAVTLPLAARWGAVGGCSMAGGLFGLAHATSGPPILLLAAVLAGTAWSALAVRTRNLCTVIVCHLLWDAAMVLTSPV
jgi:NADH dehydrogenase